MLDETVNWNDYWVGCLGHYNCRGCGRHCGVCCSSSYKENAGDACWDMIGCTFYKEMWS